MQAQGQFHPGMVTSIFMWLVNPLLHWILVVKQERGLAGAAFAQVGV